MMQNSSSYLKKDDVTAIFTSVIGYDATDAMVTFTSKIGYDATVTFTSKIGYDAKAIFTFEIGYDATECAQDCDALMKTSPLIQTCQKKGGLMKCCTM